MLAVDDKSAGTIKVACCGLFSDADEPGKLPPVHPLQPAGASSFTSVSVGDDVWVVYFDDNAMELFWMRNDNIPEDLKSILSTEYKHCDVLVHRDLVSGPVQLYFTDGEGWLLRNGQQAVRLRPDGSVLIDGGKAHRKIEINDNNISIGSEGSSAHPVAYGDKVESALNAVVRALKAAAEAGSQNPYTAFMAKALDSMTKPIEDAIEEVSSLDVTVD